MLDPRLVDELITEHTEHALRMTLAHCELTAEERAHIIAAIYYLEGTENRASCHQHSQPS